MVTRVASCTRASDGRDDWWVRPSPRSVRYRVLRGALRPAAVCGQERRDPWTTSGPGESLPGTHTPCDVTLRSSHQKGRSSSSSLDFGLVLRLNKSVKYVKRAVVPARGQAGEASQASPVLWDQQLLVLSGHEPGLTCQRTRNAWPRPRPANSRSTTWHLSKALLDQPASKQPALTSDPRASPARRRPA